MAEKIDITYIPIEDETKWTEAFIDILSDGLYEYLKDRGLLKECPERKKKVDALLEETKALTEPPVEQVNYRQVDSA